MRKSSATTIGSVLLSSLSWLVSACSVAPEPTTDEIVEQALPATTEIPREWSAEAEDTGYVDDGWVQAFGDPTLNALVEEAIQNNLDLRAGAAQVERAAGLAGLAGAALKPSVALAADLSETGGDNPASGTAYGGGLAISWEADLWGRIRAGASAAEESFAASVADFEFARQSIAAAVAKAYFLAIEFELQLELAVEAVRMYRETLELVELKEEVGQVSMQDVYLSRADLDSAEEVVRQTKSGYEQSLRTLELLLGRYPGAEIEAGEELQAVPPPIPVGLPADLLERRPDLQAAERRVAAAFFASEEARLARLPSLSLTASLSGSNSLDDLVGNIAAGLFAPLYTGGALEAQIDVANADQMAALAAYGQAVLRAFSDVETALSNEKL